MISIHAPRMGRDKFYFFDLSSCNLFQSTRPVWGATAVHKYGSYLFPAFQSTRPVWGATTRNARALVMLTFQSTRPVWGATNPVSMINPYYVFQSTRPVWGATCYFQHWQKPEDISIHAPRMGRDDDHQPNYLMLRKFQSTRPVWGATPKLKRY